MDHDLFNAGAALDHIKLARWVDLTLVGLVTAHSLNRFAADLADDLAVRPMVGSLRSVSRARNWRVASTLS